jgi:Copper type II ascorbate-dependent monooxygenase, C-terminal domain
MRSWTAVALLALLLAGCSSPEQPTAVAPTDHGSSHAAHPSEAPELKAGTGERLITVGVPVDFQPKAPEGATDEYRCFVVDPGLTEDAMITGTEFVPGNPAIVHHAILYAAYPQQVAAAEQLDAQDPGPGYECFGGSRLPSRGGDALSGLEESDWITAWAPGGGVNELPDGYGMPLPAGGRMVIQMHYNLRSGQGVDNTQVRLRVTDKNRKPLRTMLLPAPVELPCTPSESGRLCNRTDAVDDVISRFGVGSGATVAGLQLLCGGDPDNPRAGSVQTCDRPVTTESKVFAVAGHMHLLGREITVTLNPGQPDETVLLDIPNWDFDQQGARPLNKPVQVEPGDTLRVRCRHDAGLRAQLPALQGTPPRYVVWGEGTTDEMCLAILING